MPDLEKLAFPGDKDVQAISTAVGDYTIDSVVVYRDRAEVRRSVPVSLATGENELIIYDLAECVDKNSIRVEGKGNAVITDVIYSSKTTSEEMQPSSGSKEEYEALKDEENRCSVELKYMEFKEEVLKNEKNLLNKFANHVSDVHSIKGGGDSLAHLVHHDNVAAVLEFFDKFEAKMRDLDARLSNVFEEKEEIIEKIAVLKANSDKINPRKKVTSTETVRAIHVGLEAPAKTEAVLYLSYVVSNASWSSSYDVRVFTKDKSMKIQYYGLIKQQTGEDWENAKITLSTAQPSIGGSAPTLPTRIIRFKRFYENYKAAIPRDGIEMSLACSVLDEYDPTIEDEDEEQLLGGQYEFMAMNSKKGGAKQRRRSYSPSPPPRALDIDVAKVTAGLFNTTYAIPRATTIPADNTEHKVTIALVDLSPEFHYNSVPRLSPHSFLQAKAKNTSPYTILAGPANIFLDNNFIAKSELSDVSPNEEFTTSLGVDQSLRITCQPVGIVHKTRTGLLGGSKSASITYSHQFLVKNTKSHSVNIHLSEQVPLSTDERIKVHVVNPEVHKVQVQCPLPCGYAILNESNNLEWHVEVESGAELELKLLYTVEHPAQDYVQGLPK